jgi:proteasome accessory factor B
MFERDKDDLRNLGIVIEVGTFDPLFEDESG